MTKLLKTYMLALPLLSLFLGACTDELELPGSGSGDYICFTISESSDWQQAPAAATRGAQTAPLTTGMTGGCTPGGSFVMRPEAASTRSCEEPEQLYLYSYVYDGILDSGASAAENAGEKAQTRANDSSNNTVAGKGPTTTDNPPKSLNVSALQTDAAGVSKLFFTGATVERQSTGIYDFLDQQRFWPSDGRVTFFAYSPKGSHGIGDPAFGETGLSVPVSIPRESWDQEDLVYAVQSQSSLNHASVPLKMKHALVQVKFVYTTSMLYGRINTITIKNIHRKGTMTLSPGSENCQWALTDKIVSGSKDNEVYRGGSVVDPDKTELEVDGNYYGTMTNYSQSFMLLPQELEEGVTIEINYTTRSAHPELFPSGGGWNTTEIAAAGETYYAKIGGQGRKWTAGTTVIYKISNADIDVQPILEVPDDFTFSWRGGSGDFPIRSYVAVSDATAGTVEKHIVPWQIDYVNEDGSSCPDPSVWLTDMKFSGNGALDTDNPTKFTFKVPTPTALSEYEELRPHSDWIFAQAQTFGDTNCKDLSMKDGLMDTANCYVINNAGTFKFPLVYGNAMHNGLKNENAYKYHGGAVTGDSKDYVLQTFLNHRSEGITDPRINKNAGCAPGKVALLWQDNMGMIKSVKLLDEQADGFRYIQFDTGRTKDEVREGNALIAVYDTEGKIMWSWHIWMTDFIPGREAPAYSDYDPTVLNPADLRVTSHYKGATDRTQENVFMGVPIGWCSDYIRSYYSRTVSVRVRQAETAMGVPGLVKYVKVNRLPGKVSVDGNAPYYQFGRKDPLCPAEGKITAGVERQDKSLYDINGGTVMYTKVDAPKEIYETIQDPISFVRGKSDSTAADGKNNLDGKHGWSLHHYFNLWSADVADKGDVINPDGFSDVKTIYDPSPAGYEVPDFYAFSFTTYEGAGANTSSIFKRANTPFHGESVNGEGKVTDDTYKNSFAEYLGAVFFRDYRTSIGGGLRPANGIIYFAALGVRSYTSGILDWTTDRMKSDGITRASQMRAYYWSSTPQFLNFWLDKFFTNYYDPVQYASSFGCKDDEINSTVQNSRAGGLPVRPVREND